VKEGGDPIPLEKKRLGKARLVTNKRKKGKRRGRNVHETKPQVLAIGTETINAKKKEDTFTKNEKGGSSRGGERRKKEGGGFQFQGRVGEDDLQC